MKDEHRYNASAAELDGRLVGLALDEDSQPETCPRAGGENPHSHQNLGPTTQRRTNLNPPCDMTYA